ncbi:MULTISPECIES: TraR/DksA family transcriptional regulator [Sphingomonadales]|uniref:TraR/DksA family transcriptional regulator n=8 Tax=Sphingomonadales TaxID=204457 RepID=F6ESX3_SPHCR|nr:MULTISPECIES: TraR/DksA family transcriptional regulator [Sphingomonadales]ARR56411.1 conjugal transfer protein TraR [Rhizorhabdus wittichii DC-6]EZP66558.1 putative TraR/DksA family transcriptional regulator [Sphingomonas paucimobilis]AEG48589.1 TraR/DksA family transcriptional regulator [Sphingobium chlorophenolicum L-1]ALR21431.1 conjugal transfer protein TraR [Sphingobium baderi]AMK18135.1 TraR/DksA family transcriptional regulator [Sphingobium sp. MI1205]
MTDTAAIEERLTERLSELRARLTRVNADLAEPLNADSSEQAVEVEDDAGLEAEASLIVREAASIDRALERIAKGTYGECVRCGSQIAPARLDARPEAALCIDCARAEQ